MAKAFVMCLLNVPIVSLSRWPSHPHAHIRIADDVGLGIGRLVIGKSGLLNVPRGRSITKQAD
jgi:hypothetical protein